MNKTIKCPHGKKLSLVYLQVLKQGSWKRKAKKHGGYSLFIGGDICGGYDLAHGSKKKMVLLQKKLENILTTINIQEWRGDMRFVDTVKPYIEKYI